MTKADAPGTVLTFILGVAVGAAAALFLAPKSGEELRSDLAEGVSDGVDQIRTAGKDLKQRAQKVVNLAKDEVQEAIEAGNQAYGKAKNA